MSSCQKPLGHYLCTFDAPHLAEQGGVAQKIVNQIQCFNESGLKCEFICSPYAKSRIRRGIGSLPGFSDGTKWPDAHSLKGSSFLYFRRPLYSSREMIKFLSEYREENPKSVIIIEIPSYPYDNELNRPELYFAFRKEKKYRQQWYKYVNYIADFSNSNTIFNIPVLHIRNGINLRDIAPRKPSVVPNGTIEIVFSAYFAPWHGCDLLIKGLADYYRHGGSRDIHLHLAGDSCYIDSLKQLTESLGLSDCITFYGALNTVELSKLYDRCSLGVGSLGLHRRSDNLLDSSLKTREYLAKGLPFFYAGQVDVLELSPVDFCLKLESTERPVDFFKVVSFYEHLYLSESEDHLINRVRAYAEEWVSMSSGMKSVLDVLKNSI